VEWWEDWDLKKTIHSFLPFHLSERGISVGWFPLLSAAIEADGLAFDVQ